MALDIPPIFSSSMGMSKETSDRILQYELQLLGAELPELKKFRAYYDGEQQITFGSEKFRQVFGDHFKGFRSNWCAPVVEAIADKLHWEGLRLGTDEEEIKNNQDTAKKIWNIFRANDMDEQQADLFEGALVEGHSYAIPWPDKERDVRIDWNPADLIRVRFADDDHRKIIWGTKRWQAASGDIYITVYTLNAIYKYVENQNQRILDPQHGIEALRPDIGPGLTWQPRRVPGESWPLPNPYDFIPIVEFPNKRGSELTDVIPLQDSINYLLMQILSAAGYQGFPQRVFFSGVKEPVGGWSNEPGRVWQLPPDLDPEGKLLHGQAHEFNAADLAGLRSTVEMFLQHVAHQTKTPTRLFFESDRGGRGDAPSGESLLVDDQPSIDKAEDRMRRFGNAGYRLVQMVAKMSDNVPDNIPLGELDWRDPRSKYRTALIQEGALMVEKMGLPVRWVATQLGLTQDELNLLYSELEAQKAEQEEMANQEMERQVELAKETRPEPSPNAPPSRNQ